MHFPCELIDDVFLSATTMMAVGVCAMTGLCAARISSFLPPSFDTPFLSTPRVVGLHTQCGRLLRRVRLAAAAVIRCLLLRCLPIFLTPVFFPHHTTIPQYQTQYRHKRSRVLLFRPSLPLSLSLLFTHHAHLTRARERLACVCHSQLTPALFFLLTAADGGVADNVAFFLAYLLSHTHKRRRR